MTQLFDYIFLKPNITKNNLGTVQHQTRKLVSPHFSLGHKFLVIRFLTKQYNYTRYKIWKKTIEFEDMSLVELVKNDPIV